MTPTACSAIGLWRYPVKSMGGEALDALPFEAGGIVGDRQYAVVMTENGRILTAKRTPRLLDASARWCENRVEITLPDGRVVTSDDPTVAGVLTAWLGTPVRLERTAGQVRTVADYPNDLTDPRRVSSFDLPAWGFADEAPVHLLSQGTLRQARAAHPRGDWDARRFRPNVLLDSSDGDAVGPDLVGRLVELGEATLAITSGCRRCVMITQPQRGLPADRELLRTVLGRFDAVLGVYAEVASAGEVRTGDRMTVGPRIAARTPATVEVAEV
ncbi:MOSC domain-containing protein [Micromonosporaceae bacterium Da 78-11]